MHAGKPAVDRFDSPAELVERVRPLLCKRDLDPSLGDPKVDWPQELLSAVAKLAKQCVQPRASVRRLKGNGTLACFLGNTLTRRETKKKSVSICSWV